MTAASQPLTSAMLHEPTATEVWSTGGERMGIRDGAAAIVVEPTRWHASSSSRTPISGTDGLAGFGSEAEALAHLRGKLAAALAAVDARIARTTAPGWICPTCNDPSCG